MRSAEADGKGLRRGSAWALTTLTTVSAGGFAFWVLAAATSSDTGAVGLAAAWYTVVQLVVSLCALGAPILINRRGASADAARIAGSAATTVAIAALLLGLLAPLLAGSFWTDLGGRSGLALGPWIAIGTVGASLTLVVDARLISLRRWRAVYLRAAIPTLVRLPLLYLDPLDDRGTWIAILAIAPIAISGIVTTTILLARRDLQVAPPLALSAADRRFLGVQHVGAAAAQAPYHVIPFLVAQHVSGPTNAAFYLIWSIGVMAAMLPQALTQILLSETSLEVRGRVPRIRQTLVANIALGASGWILSIRFAEPILDLIGPIYGSMAPVLPWLLLAALSWGLTSICLTEARLIDDGQTTTLITLTIALGSVGLGLLWIPSQPVWGATYAWLAANLLAMVLGMGALERRWRISVKGRDVD